MIIDLSVLVDQDTPVYPGDPKVEITPIADFEKYGMSDHKVTFGVHTGTHMDAPWHMISEGKKIDELSPDKFIGRGRLIEGLDLKVVKNSGVEEGDIVLFKCGSKLFNQPGYYGSWPEIPEEIADYLIDKKIKAVGVDMPSPDHEPFKIHKKLLGAEILIIENLTNLDKLAGREFTVYALPIKLDLDGAPARVIAEVE